MVYIKAGRNGEGNRTRRRAASPLFGGLRVIREGLGPDDRVIIDGLQRAKPGGKVTPHMSHISPPSTPTQAPPSGYTEPLPTGATAASGPTA